MRVVVDTNVLVSSFFGGLPRKVVDLWRTGNLTLCLSGALVDEYVEVLTRLGLEAGLLRELLALFASGFNLVFEAEPPAVDAVAPDSDDDMLFACALALQAEAIVTGDKAVRRVGNFKGIDVLTPAEFLARRGIGES